MDITELLTFSVENRASDLHLSSGLPPLIQVDGNLRPIDRPPLEHPGVHVLVRDITNDRQRWDYQEQLEVDFSFEIQGLPASASTPSTSSTGRRPPFALFPCRY